MLNRNLVIEFHNVKISIENFQINKLHEIYNLKMYFSFDENGDLMNS